MQIETSTKKVPLASLGDGLLSFSSTSTTPAEARERLLSPPSNSSNLRVSWVSQELLSTQTQAPVILLEQDAALLAEWAEDFLDVKLQA